MKNLFLHFLAFSNFLFSQEKEIPFCNLEFKVNTDILQSSDKLKLIITNKDKFPIKINKRFSNILVQALNLEKYDSISKKFVFLGHSNADVDALGTHEKYKSLKPNQSKTYEFNILKLPLVVKKMETKGIYRFQLWFDTQTLVSYKNLKCYAQDFSSETIIYELK